MIACRRFLCALVAALVGWAAPPAGAQDQLTPLSDMVLDSTALLMPTNATYGRAINGLAFQGESLLTYNGYQYAAWYHNGTSGANTEDFYIARRNLAGSTWEVVDTNLNLDNGDGTPPGSIWDAHNVISLGISGDGRIHAAWDHHNNTLRYMNTVAGVATDPGNAVWNAGMFGAERNALNAGGVAIGDVTYPQFVTHSTTGELLFNYRTGSSGNGNSLIATYNPPNDTWNTPHVYINGQTPIPYSDPWGSNSNERNAYINGMDVDANGRIHVTWTWRETATGGSNHDIMYAYSDDDGATWRNNAGTNLGAVMTMNSPGIIVVPMNRGNTLMNQQAQAVDPDGRVHIIMWHLKDGQPQINNFTAAPAAYYHYFRDPATSAWTKIELPTSRAVGSRPDMAYDLDGNLYVAYVSPGPGDGQGVTANYYTEGDLLIATASKASAYTDWTIMHTDTRDFSGEPRIDQNRLLQYGVLSVIMQENSDVISTRTGTPLHVLEYNKLAKNLVWDGDQAATWDTSVGTDWDSDGNNAGDAAFAAGNRVTFDDDASTFTLNIASPVAPAATNFKNTVAKSYVITGSTIGGTGGLHVTGGGMVTLAGGANSYTGPTQITSGKLVLSGAATIAASPTINVAAGATLDVTATTAGSMTLNGQALAIDGNVVGNVIATNNSTVNVNSTTSLEGNLTIQSGSLATGAGRITGNLVATNGTLRVGGVGLPSVVVPVTTVIDDFNSPGLGQYTQTRVLDNGVSEANVSFTDASGALVASYAGTVNQPEQVLLLRNDSNLGIGQTLLVDVAMPNSTSQMDFGIAVSESVSPNGAANPTPTDTRNTFDWASIYIRPSANEIRNTRSINGTVATTSNVLTGVNETAVAQLLIERTSATSFTLGYVNTSSVRTNAATISFTENNIGTAIGFYGDLRAIGGSLGSFDNLRVFDTVVQTVGQELTIDGDYTQSAGATLEIDIFNPNNVDLLDVGGNFAAGGTLSVAFAAGAPAPQPGDDFDILDFESFTGVFDAVALPALGPGLIWDNHRLLTNGVLEVVAGLAGDYNDDGTVDAADYVVWRNTDGAVGAGLAADGNSDLHVDNADYILWKANFGAVLAAASAGLPSTTVPEPASLVLLAAACSIGLQRRRAK